MNRWTNHSDKVQGLQVQFYAAVDGGSPVLLDHSRLNSALVISVFLLRQVPFHGSPATNNSFRLVSTAWAGVDLSYSTATTDWGNSINATFPIDFYRSRSLEWEEELDQASPNITNISSSAIGVGR